METLRPHPIVFAVAGIAPLALTVALAVCSAGCGGDTFSDGGAGPRDAAAADAAPTDAAVGDAAAPDPDAGGPAPALDWEDCEGDGRTLTAGPDDYRDVLATLEPGDTLQLTAGDYSRGLPVSRSGQEGRCIVIEGAPGARPRFMGSNSFNIIAFRGVSWVKVRGFDIDGLGRNGFGVASQGADVPVHHIVIEDLEMIGLAGDRSIVGIASYTPSWDWVIRGNRILEAGTGLYLGNSDGTQPFVRGLIEHNVVINPLGYGMEIKHQNASGRGGLGLADLPDEATTIIRYNVFAKPVVGDTPRPNLLLGHFPASGSGQDDQYLVYGNFFYENSTENLFQGEGNIALYSNVFINRAGGGIIIRPHNGVPGDIDVFQNTFLVRDRAVRVTGGDPDRTQAIYANISYAGEAISGDSRVDISDNLEGSLGSASSTLVRPEGMVGVDLDLHPMSGASVDGTTAAPGFSDADLDFDGILRTGMVRGAYVAGGPVWQLSLSMHP